jgi:hypothetical protein
MSTPDGTGPSGWANIIMNLNIDTSEGDQASFLAGIPENIDLSLRDQVLRLRNTQMTEERKKMWIALKALAEGKLTSEDQRNIICKLAESYNGFIGWEGESGDEPGW